MQHDSCPLNIKHQYSEIVDVVVELCNKILPLGPAKTEDKANRIFFRTVFCFP